MSNDNSIEPNHLPAFIQPPEGPLNEASSPLLNPLPVIQENPENRHTSEEEFNLHKLEIRTIQRALNYTSNNRTEAAQLLGISRRTLQRKLKELPK